MNKKLFGTLLMGSLLMGGTFVSCQDYDDEIADLQSQINDLKGLKTEVESVKGSLGISMSECQSAINAAIKAIPECDAKKALEAATAAGATAEDALKAANAAAEAAKTAGLDEAAVKALVAAQLEAEKFATIAALDAKANEILAELAKKQDAGKYLTANDLEAIKADVKKLQDEAADVLPQRLSSLVFAPKTYINGIEAIEFANLKYQGWTDRKQDVPNLVDAKKVAVTYSIANEGATAEYYVSPENTALKSIASLKFLSQEATNTRALNAAISTDLSKATIKDGKLVLKLKKDDTANWGTPSHISDGDSKETFPIVALKAVLADEVLTAEEKAAKAEVAVFSDWARVIETTSTPIIDNKKVVAHTAHGAWDYVTSRNDDAVKSHFWNYSTVYPTINHLGETKANPNTTDSKKYIAAHATYKESIDLNTLTQVCTFTGTNVSGILNDDPKAAADLGLSIKYELVDYWYKNQEDTKDATNQKLFAKLEGSILTATSENGLVNNADAVGRTPLICATLMDGDKIVDVCYFKVQWDEIVVPATYFVGDDATLDAVPFACPGTEYDAWLGETYMNNLYAAMLNGAGMTRDQFHTAFPKVLTKSPLETGDYAWTATAGKIQGDLYLGAVTDAAKAAVAKGDMKGFKVVGYITDLADDAELTSTHNIEIKAAAEAINPTSEKNFTTDAFFAYKSADGQSYVIVPVKIQVNAGTYANVYNYLDPQWEENGGKLEVATSGASINKTRPVNPTLYSDEAFGNKTFKTTQLIGNFTYGYMKDKKMPSNISGLVTYKAAGAAATVAATDIVFDGARLAEVASQTNTKVADWSLSADLKTLYYGNPKVAAAEIVKNEVYLVDNAAGTGTTGAIDAEPTKPALMLVGNYVPVKVTANHGCYPIDFDKYIVRFIKPLEIGLVGGGIQLQDILNEGDAKSVTLSDKYTLKEAFGSKTVIKLFGADKNTTLIEWYEIKNIVISMENATINIDANGKIVEDESKFSKLSEILNASNKQAYVLKTVKNTGTATAPVWTETSDPAEIEGLKFHNNSGQAITKDLIIKLPVSMDTKWQKGLNEKISVTVKPNL